MTTTLPDCDRARSGRAGNGATVRGDLRCAGPARAAGSEKEIVELRRGHLPAARCRGFGEPAVVFPAFPGPPVCSDHCVAGLDRRADPGRRPEVGL